MATVLDFELADGHALRVGDETGTGRARRTVVGLTAIEIGGMGRITVSPGGADVNTLATQRDSRSSELDALLRKRVVANVAEAEERARQAAQRRQDAAACQQLLQALAPKGVESLEADLAARTQRLAELRAALAALPAPAEGDAELPTLAAAQAHAERAKAALDDATAALNQAKVAAGRAQSGQAAARQELAAAQATVNDPQRAQRLATAHQGLSDALAHEATARMRVDGTAAELKSVNLVALRQDVDRFARSAQRAACGRAARAPAPGHPAPGNRPGRQGRTGPGRTARRARAGTGSRWPPRRSTRPRAAALDLLLALLREKRSALARRLRAPLQKHLDRYLSILFPCARIEVADDLSPGPITRNGPRGPERGEFEELSVGTREQMGIVARLAYADLL